MKAFLLIIYLVTVLWAFPVFGDERAFQCGECHSKNPKLVRMHRAVGYKDCLLCHKPGNFNFGQSSSVKTPTPEQARRMVEDPICIRCHGDRDTGR